MEKTKLYEVEASLSKMLLNKSKNSFVIKYGRSVLGTLEISRGSIQWYPRKGRNPITLNWKQFADLMEEQ